MSVEYPVAGAEYSKPRRAYLFASHSTMASSTPPQPPDFAPLLLARRFVMLAHNSIYLVVEVPVGPEARA